ncbi:hypothetical protein EQM14_04945 [Caproiciproducens sp. NJN-50]|uniref:hypothetical protein n=1 Tax=Acutalibacteraceae TaxID=3082771 RepID=UPI000FFE31A9|nr:MULTISPECIES: hypothetical protein [Acutalibacteraceae]QAT49173.1 hypothetical protein EQM14_04945 [Caproiciproducens sp. NJN-50]
MYTDPRLTAGTLEQIRRVRGTGACQRRFQEIIRQQKEGAAKLLNGGGLRFATLFALKPQIEEAGLEPKLSGKMQAALQICNKVLEEKKSLPGGGIPYSDENVRNAFQWIFQTGARDDGLSNEYDEILDLCAGVLTRRYREKNILSGLTELIFRRNRKKGYLHDLIWAFFQIHDPGSLRYIAPYLRSSNTRDRELAHLLLHLPEGGDVRKREEQYRNFMSWLQENSAYLYYTGESLQSSNQPEICSLDREAKYLGKQISPRKRTPVDPLTQEEEESLSCFAQAEENEKAVLSDYSGKLHARNPELWNQWIHSPVSEQIRVAKGGTGRRLV